MGSGLPPILCRGTDAAGFSGRAHKIQPHHRPPANGGGLAAKPSSAMLGALGAVSSVG